LEATEVVELQAARAMEAAKVGAGVAVDCLQAFLELLRELSFG
jgi:hypothetical protein